MSTHSIRMTRVVAFCALPVGLFILGPASASVIYTSRTSTVSITEGGVTTTRSATDLNPFSASLASTSLPNIIFATQQSQISGNTITVDLKAAGQFDTTISKFDLTFVVDAPIDFTINGRNDDEGPIDPSESGITLSGPVTLGLSDINCINVAGHHCTYNNQNPFPFPSSTKTLIPGTYTLEAFAIGGDGPGAGQGTANLTFSLKPVPLPASTLLLGSALGMLALFGLRKQQRTDFSF